MVSDKMTSNWHGALERGRNDAGKVRDGLESGRQKSGEVSS